MSSLVAHEGIGTLLEAVKLLGDQGVRVRALHRRAGRRHPSGPRCSGRPPGSASTPSSPGGSRRAKVRDYHAVLDVSVVTRTPERVCQLVTPLKPVEAMASGLPVVVSSVRALPPRSCRDGETGLLFPPLDAGALAEAARELLDNPELRRKLGTSAREWVGRDRTWAHNAARYHEIYRRVRGDAGDE